MVVVAPTVVHNDDKTLTVTWANLTNTDTGRAVHYARYADKTVQATGTFGSGAAAMEGSNLSTPVWGAVHGPQGNVISLADNVLEVIAESPLALRPNVTGGDGTTSVTVTMICVMRGA